MTVEALNAQCNALIQRAEADPDTFPAVEQEVLALLEAAERAGDCPPLAIRMLRRRLAELGKALATEPSPPKPKRPRL